MRNFKLIIILGLCSLTFLALQFCFMRYVSGQKKADGEGTAGGSSPAFQNYENLKAFAKVSQQHDIEVILIEPAVLDRIMHKNVSQTSDSCLYLCDNSHITTLGVLGNYWKNEIDVLKSFHEAGFTISHVAQVDSGIISEHSGSPQEIPTHYFFTRRSHVIHLVLLYVRHGNYLWHGAVRWKRTLQRQLMDAQVSFSDLRFGQEQGAYDKMEIVKVQLDGLHINAPKYPLLFLQAIPQAKYIECNHTRAQDFYKRFGKESSTEAVNFKHKAQDVLLKGKTILDELGIRFWLSSGTCLGWFRQCDIIPYSKDVDFGIWIKDYDIRLVPAFQMSGFPLIHLFGKTSDSFELSFKGGDVKLDMFFFYEDDHHMWNGGTQAKTGNKYKYLFPKFSLCWTELLGLKVRVPCQTEAYIEANYGKDWFTPVKQWDWKKSPPNVRENGQWPEKEREKVVQLFQ